MISSCTECRQVRLIVFSNQLGVRMCQGCLAAYLQRRRIEAGLEAPLPLPEPPPAPEPWKLAEPEYWNINRPEPRVVTLKGGAQLVLDGRIPKALYLSGHWYWTCLSPRNGHGQNKE